VPHAPHGYNRTTGRFDLRNSPIRGYIDSLALLDRTLGDLRRSMQAAGTWTNTTVLVTTDHPYREAEQVDGKSDRRIPFLLKLAGQRAGAAYDAPFNAILAHRLLLAVLSGEIGDTAAAARWLDANRARAPLD
jgi:arylsulfatase A-like enzyme